MVRYVLAGDLFAQTSRNWWLMVLRGTAAVLFGLLAILWPGPTLVALAVVFGAFALVDGCFLAAAALRAPRGSRAGTAVRAALGIVLGLVALLWPLAALVALVFVIGFWAVLTGVFEIITAVRLRAHISSEWLLVFVGALSVVFGLLLWFWPLVGAEVLLLAVGVYAVILGAVLVVAGLRLRGASGQGAGTRERAADTGTADTGTGGAEERQSGGGGRHRAPGRRARPPEEFPEDPA
ncbi:HdeD family acid-resistance protein [Nocardiopsis sp. LOL_012]|uniref:HdeD family acid-resistance protein n=1 Tax=Nocardiopsis sp. LOL_012 TaxID=3345409 RepID=UPI003A83533A